MQGWTFFMKQECEQPYYEQLMCCLQQLYATKTIYPKQHEIFRCLELTPYEEIKVVIVGQDPYHEANQAHGLSFSVNKGIPLPPSLRNIYRELQDDVGVVPAKHGDLTAWAKQGVLLLNTVLSVEQGKANSHKGLGWEIFTDHVFEYVNQRKQPVAFLLWGNHAQEKEALITNPQHLVLKSSHPSPLSAYRGFFGSRPFSKVNEFLSLNHMNPIQWQLEDAIHDVSY